MHFLRNQIRNARKRENLLQLCGISCYNVSKSLAIFNNAKPKIFRHIANCTARDEGLVALNAYLQKHKACEGQVTNNRVVVTFSTVIQVRAIRNWSVSVAKPLKCGGRPCCLCSSPSPLCSDHNGYMKGHLPLCDTRRLMYSRFVAILGAPTSAAALALAEESAPIDDWLENVRLLLIQSDYLQRLHTQEFSYIYANSSLDSVRAYNPNGGNFYYDEHHLYLRFNAHVSPLYTLDNMYRVGVAQSIRRREEKYATTEPAGSVRAVYICSGPTLYVYLMEAILILLCELNKRHFLETNNARFQLKISCVQTFMSSYRLYLRHARSSSRHSAGLRYLCAMFSIIRCVLYSRLLL